MSNFMNPAMPPVVTGGPVGQEVRQQSQQWWTKADTGASTGGPAAEAVSVGDIVQIGARFGLIVSSDPELGVRVAWLTDVTDPVDLAELGQE